MKYTRRVEFPYKGLYAVIDAIEFKYESCMLRAQECSDDDCRSDLENDAALLKSMIEVLKEERDAWNQELKFKSLKKERSEDGR